MSDAVVEKQEEKPVFDFKRVYFTHQQKYLAAFRRMQGGKPTVEDQENWEAQQLLVVQKALVSIPRKLLRDDTPENVDWSKPESTEWWLFGALDILHSEFVDAYKELQKK
ncbi:MAG: hypothetical protein SFZ02_19145 [bacterium]|nr:hypothetical protein [bacterium]